MDISKKLHILDELFHLYDKAIIDEAIACEKGCAHCCTRNVTVTTLEAYRLVDRLGVEALEQLYGRLADAAGEGRFKPLVTINALAEITAMDEDPPDEICDPAWTPCALLENDLCTEYALRPFACRCMVSAAVCGEGGFAEMNEYLVSVNTVFQQAIEHIDVPGVTGNLLDVLAMFKEVENRSLYLTGMMRPESTGMPVNRHVKMLMIPPAQRDRLQPIVEKIQGLLAG